MLIQMYVLFSDPTQTLDSDEENEGAIPILNQQGKPVK